MKNSVNRDLFIRNSQTKIIWMKRRVFEIRISYERIILMKKWITKQSSAFVLGFLDKLKEFRSTPDNVVEALNIVTQYITNKYWH